MFKWKDSVQNITYLVSKLSNLYISTMDNTASGAGRTCGTEWTTVRQQEIRTEELVRHHRRLLELGLVERKDELASARRRFNHLTGQSGLDSMRRDLRDGRKCWRDVTSDRKQAAITLDTVVGGLNQLRKDYGF